MLHYKINSITAQLAIFTLLKIDKIQSVQATDWLVNKEEETVTIQKLAIIIIAAMLRIWNQYHLKIKKHETNITMKYFIRTVQFHAETSS